MSTDLLVELLQTLDAPQPRICELERYATGKQAMSFLSVDQRTALPKFGRLASNLPRLAVTSLAERLRITGFTGVDVWDDWLRQDMDQLSSIAHNEALTFGAGYVIVWGESGSPLVSVESAKQVAVIRDPGTREVVSAVKRWRTKSTTEAVVYLPDRIERHRANTPGAATAGFDLIETLDNPLGVVPVVQLKNGERLLDECGASEIDDLMPLVDGLNKILTDMLVSAEYTARPRRWATGIELVEQPVLDDNGEPVLEAGEPVMETVNPIPEGNRAMISENDGAKFGQLAAAELTGYENAVNVLLGQVMAVSALPAHMIGVMTDNPSSADAIRAAEASLTARAEARQKVFGRAWEQVARLMVAIRDGVDVDTVNCRVQWADASTRSVAQEADAAVKLHQAGILSRAGTLERLGYSADEIEQELERAADEAINEGSMAGLYGRRGGVRNAAALQLTNTDGSPVTEF